MKDLSIVITAAKNGWIVRVNRGEPHDGTSVNYNYEVDEYVFVNSVELVGMVAQILGVKVKTS